MHKFLRAVGFSMYQKKHDIDRLLEELIRDQGHAEITCQFCDAVYRFSKEDLEELAENLRKSKNNEKA